MENLQNQTSQGGNAPQRNRYISAAELVAQMKLAFGNAKEPEILSELQSVGITETHLNDYLQKIEHLESLNAAQRKEYGEQYDSTEKFDKKFEEIDALFMRHRNLAKIAFKNDRLAYTTLGINEPKKRAYAAWYLQVKNFYVQLIANADFKTKAAGINITDEVVAGQQEALQQIAVLKETQKKETGEAQKATETRDEALDELYPKYRDLVDYAKVLFKDNQTLEKLGIVVKREM